MNNTEIVHEDVNVNVEAKTVDIPVRVTMSSINEDAFKFTASIDEVGQIILTPTSKEMEFTSANTANNVEYDIPIAEQETVTKLEGNLITKETSIILKANLLTEVENEIISADVDAIGQVVIYPTDKNSVFVSASFDDSLNLITEGIEMHEYFDGYKLINPGNGWYVKDPNQRLVASGIETLKDAKIFVCETELKKLKALDENVENSSETVDTQVEAEVIEEAVIDAKEVDEFKPYEIEAALVSITNDYSDAEGAIKCDTEEEVKHCIKLLSDHYEEVSEKTPNIIEYKQLKVVTESVEERSTTDIVDAFLRGDIALFSDEGKPQESYKHISELDSNGYCYYYDEESDAVISYPCEE